MFYHVRWKTIELYLACKPTKAFKREFRETGPRSDTHAPIPPPRLHDTERISFSVYMMPEWNFLPEREFHSEPKPESTQSRKDTMKFVKKQKKTRIVRALWLAERCFFAWKSVNMVVTSSSFSIRALITQARIWKSELKTRQIYYIHPLTRGLKPWKIFTNTLCLLFFA